MHFTPGHFLRMPNGVFGLDIRSGLRTKLQAPVSIVFKICYFMDTLMLNGSLKLLGFLIEWS